MPEPSQRTRQTSAEPTPRCGASRDMRGKRRGMSATARQKYPIALARHGRPFLPACLGGPPGASRGGNTGQSQDPVLGPRRTGSCSRSRQVRTGSRDRPFPQAKPRQADPASAPGRLKSFGEPLEAIVVSCDIGSPPRSPRSSHALQAVGHNPCFFPLPDALLCSPWHSCFWPVAGCPHVASIAPIDPRRRWSNSVEPRTSATST